MTSKTGDGNSPWDDKYLDKTPAMKIVTDFWAKPIPTTQFDWSAVEDGYEPGRPIGYGKTEAEAVKDLREQLE